MIGQLEGGRRWKSCHFEAKDSLDIYGWGARTNKKVSELLQHVMRMCPPAWHFSHSCCLGQGSRVMLEKRAHAQQLFLRINKARKLNCMLSMQVFLQSHPPHCLLHALGPSLTFFPAALDYSIMLKAGCSCLFSPLYLCTCRYHAVTKYMAISHSSLCNPFTHALEHGELTDDCFWFP